MNGKKKISDSFIDSRLVTTIALITVIINIVRTGQPYIHERDNHVVGNWMVVNGGKALLFNISVILSVPPSGHGQDRF